MDVGDLVSDFSNLKISALSKTLLINQYVDEVTIGPNARISPLKAPSNSPQFVTRTEQPTSMCTVGSPKRCKGNSFEYGLLRTYEKNTQEMIYESMDKHVKTVEEFDKQQRQRKIEQWKQQKALQLQQIQYQEALVMKAMQDIEEESKLEFQRAAARNIQRQQENDRKLKAKAVEEQKSQQLLTSFTTAEKEFLITFKEIDGLFKNNQEAKTETVNYEADFKQLCNQFTNIGSKLKKTEQDVLILKDLLTNIRKLKDTLKNTIKEHYQKRQREAAEKVAVLKKKEEEAKAKQAAAQEIITKVEVAPKPSVNVDDIGKSMLKQYVQLQAFLQTHQNSYKLLVDDKKLQKFKMDLRMAITTPVNAISAVSSVHLRDKYTRLHNLLSGKTVQIGNGRINASQHPQGIPYAMDLLAKVFVKQGDLTISSSPEAAFAYATIIVTLWNDFPLFGQLLLAHFYKACPYLVPIIFEKQTGQTDEEFYTLIGYHYTNGVIEKQDTFLKRMTGLAKFYFSIMISHTRRGSANNPHPLGCGWTWFARVLNQEPCVDITATLIYTFLEVTGVFMQQMYGKQFQKLIVYIHKYQLALLKLKDSGGPLARLEVLLQNYNKDGRFSSPQGMLAKNFW